MPSAEPSTSKPQAAATGLSLRTLGLLFGLALVLRLGHVLAMSASPYFDNPIIDAGTYQGLATSIAAGRGHPEAVFWHPPGYPYFLGLIWSLVGQSFLWPRLAQALLGALAVVLTAWIGARSFGSRAGLGAGLAAAGYGMLIYFDGELLPPTLALFLVLLAVAIAIAGRDRPGRWHWLVAGAVGGLAATVIATLLLVPLVVAGFARRKAGWVLLGTALAIAPVTLRNLVRGHEFVLISVNGGVNFWIGNNPQYQKMVDLRPDASWKRLVDEPGRAGVRGAANSSRYFVRKAWTWAAHNPWAFARLQLHKLRLFVGGNEIYRNQAIYPARLDSPVLRVLLWKIPDLAFPFGLLLPLSALGLWVGARRAPLLAGLVAALSLSVLAFFITARYRVVLVPLLLVFAGQAVACLAGQSSWRPRLIAAAALVALFLIANLGQGRMDDKMNADAEYSLGVRLGEKGQFKQAAALFESALASKPDYAEAWLNLSVCYDILGRHEDARQAFARAFALDREATLRLLRDFLSEGKRDAAQALLGHLAAVRATRAE
ncbi:MAG TPA: tetratricopeptide repeat protein [Polyangia bacterium]|nr:tetratricopeptide repeat protein [Polyangia bacterium]